MRKPKERSRTRKAHVLEYQVNISFDPRDEIYVTRVPELDNCHSHGSTPEEALSNIRQAIELWLETARERKISVPEPIARRRFSGKFVLRASPKLHATLAKEALQRGKSMNELAVELIDSGLKNTG